MKGHKLTLLLVILTILLSSFSLAVWTYDDMSNTSTFRWNMSNGISIESSNNYFLFDNNAGTGDVFTDNKFSYNELGTQPISFMWRLNNNDSVKNYGYIGLGTAGTGATGYYAKVYYHPNEHLYVEFNDSFAYDWAPSATKWKPNNATPQDFIMIFYPETGTGGKFEFGYKNVTAYSDAFTKTGFKNMVNATLDDSRGGSFNRYFRWNPTITLLNQSAVTGAVWRLYDFGTDANLLPVTQRSVGARDIVNNNTILDFKINYNGTIYRTTNGTLYLNFENTSNTWEKYNVVVDGNSNGGYMTEQYLNYNFTLAETNSTFNVSNGQINFVLWTNSNHEILKTYEQRINNTNVSVIAISTRMNVTSYNSVAGAGQEVTFSTNGYTYRTKKYNFSMTANDSAGFIVTLDSNYCNQSMYDSFSKRVLSTFSILEGGVVYRTTNSTTLIPKDTWTNCSETTHTLTIDSSLNGGYFTELLNSQSIMATNYSIVNDRIEIIGSNALDQSPIPSITCQINATNITSIGGICYLNHTQSDARLSVFASGYNFTTDTFALTGNLTYHQNLTLSKVMNFVIYREFDQTCFPFATNMNMSMVVYCQGASQQFNITSCNQNLTIGCSFDSIVLAHNNITFNYFRTLIPAYNDTLVNWYMLDLNQDTGVQVIINLLDLSGQYNTGIIRLKRYFGTSQAEIIEQHFDLENSVNLYLLRHARYSVEVCNQVGMCVSLGELIGDVAEEKTLTIPNLAFYPTNALLGNNITWSINWTANNRISMNYNDTTHATTMIEYLIYNGSNTAILYYNNTIMTYDLYATYIIPVAYYNTSFIACFRAYQPSLGIIKDCRTFYEAAEPFGYWEGFTAGEIYKVRWWGSLIFLFVIMFLFSPYSIKAGLVLTNIMFWLFIQFRWLLTSSSATDYTILFITCVLSVIYIIGMETRSGGQVAG